LNDKKIGEWVGNSKDVYSHTPYIYLDGDSAIRVKFRGVKVKKGDTLTVVEPAPPGYVSFLPERVVD
jgi:alpha-glucuronidase